MATEDRMSNMIHNGILRHQLMSKVCLDTPKKLVGQLNIGTKVKQLHNTPMEEQE
jgi:hypothetical protein